MKLYVSIMFQVNQMFTVTKHSSLGSIALYVDIKIKEKLDSGQSPSWNVNFSTLFNRPMIIFLPEQKNKIHRSSEFRFKYLLVEQNS